MKWKRIASLMAVKSKTILRGTAVVTTKREKVVEQVVQSARTGKEKWSVAATDPIDLEVQTTETCT
jgi:hypothetical protein